MSAFVKVTNEYVKKHLYDNARLDHIRIYKGILLDDTYPMMFDGSKYSRVSKSNNNLYLTWMEISPSWNGYPSRRNSLICSFSSVIASEYGTVFKVYPLESQPIGICPKNDIWFSFRYLKKKMEKYLRYIDARDFTIIMGELFFILHQMKKNVPPEKFQIPDTILFNLFTYKEELNEFKELINWVDFKQFKEYLKNTYDMDVNMQPLHYVNYFDDTRNYLEFVKDLKKIGLFKFLEDGLNSQKNDFKLGNVDNVMSFNRGDNELWFSGKCLLIPTN